MYRRLQLRRQISMLVSMRIGYGGTILTLLLIRVNTPNSLMWQIVRNGGGNTNPFYKAKPVLAD